MILIGLGSNLALDGYQRAEIFASAISMITERCARPRVSRLYASDSWPDPSAPPYLNAVACLEEGPEALVLLNMLLDIERTFGRTRSEQNAPRTLDLDIVDYAGVVSLPGANPILPHPRAHERRFVLEPVRDLEADWRHPASGARIKDLIDAAPQGGTRVVAEHWLEFKGSSAKLLPHLHNHDSICI